MLNFTYVAQFEFWQRLSSFVAKYVDTASSGPFWGRVYCLSLLCTITMVFKTFYVIFGIWSQCFEPTDTHANKNFSMNIAYNGKG